MLCFFGISALLVYFRYSQCISTFVIFGFWTSCIFSFRKAAIKPSGFIKIALHLFSSCQLPIHLIICITYSVMIYKAISQRRNSGEIFLDIKYHNVAFN